MGRPRTGTSTLGNCEAIRLPFPAARMMASACEVMRLGRMGAEVRRTRETWLKTSRPSSCYERAHTARGSWQAERSLTRRGGTFRVRDSQKTGVFRYATRTGGQ